MAKLTQLQPRLKTLDLSIVKPRAAVTDQERGSDERHRLYTSTRWLAERDTFLRQPENAICRPCRGRGFVIAAFAVDHIDGHRRPDWRERFWQRDRWQPICRACHAAKAAAELAEWRRAAGSEA